MNIKTFIIIKKCHYFFFPSIVAKNGIVIAVEKKQKSPLYENISINKVSLCVCVCVCILYNCIPLGHSCGVLCVCVYVV